MGSNHLFSFCLPLIDYAAEAGRDKDEAAFELVPWTKAVYAASTTRGDFRETITSQPSSYHVYNTLTSHDLTHTASHPSHHHRIDVHFLILQGINTAFLPSLYLWSFRSQVL